MGIIIEGLVVLVLAMLLAAIVAVAVFTVKGAKKVNNKFATTKEGVRAKAIEYGLATAPVNYEDMGEEEQVVHQKINHITQDMRKKILPSAMRGQLTSIEQTLQDIASQWNKVSSEDKYIVEKSLDEYIPETLSEYLSLPKSDNSQIIRERAEVKVQRNFTMIADQLTQINYRAAIQSERKISDMNSFLTTKFNYDNSLNLEKRD